MAGLFVRERLRALSRLDTVRVIQPMPIPFWKMAADVELGACDYQRPLVNDGVPEVHRLAMRYVPRIGHFLNPALYAGTVLPLLSAWKNKLSVDFLDAHFSWPDGVAAARLAQKLGLPFSVTLRGVLGRFVADAMKRRSIIWALNRAATVIAVSGDLKNQAVRLGIPGEKIHVIPNGVDDSIFNPGDGQAARRHLGRAADEILLITVGHLCPRKGFHRVLRILPELLRHNARARYVIVGQDGAEEPWEGRLRREVCDLGLQDVVTFTGALPPDCVAEWLRAADLFVLPTDNEGWCNALYEAVAVGLPVVCTDVGGNGEVIDGSSGVLVPVGDQAELLRSVRRVIDRMPGPRVSKSVRTWATVARETHEVLLGAVEFQRSGRHDSTPLSIGQSRKLRSEQPIL